jgi:ketosteroid isomerase-like protein
VSPDSPECYIRASTEAFIWGPAMSERASILQTIHDAYEARESGDMAALLALCDPKVQLKIAGSERLCGACVTLNGHAEVASGLAGLVETFGFEAVEMLDTVIEGRKAAIHWRATLRHRPTDEMFKTELFDLWTVGEDGLVIGLTQFCDTALVAEYLSRI